MPPLEPLSVYTVLWGFSTQLEHLKGPLGGPRGPWLASLMLLCLAAALVPHNKTLIALAYSMRCVWWLNRWPFMWASEIIGGLTDVTVVLHLLVASSRASNPARNKHDDSKQFTAGLSLSMRRQVAWFYFFAGFWKLNTSFLNHRYSCASVFVAQLLDAYAPPHLLTAANVNLAIHAAPALTVQLELGIGVAMLLGEYSPTALRRYFRRVGILLALLLHLGIDVTPAPHNIANFSHKAGLRYLWFAPHGTSTAACEVLRRPLSIGASYAAMSAAALACTIALQQPVLWAQWMSSPSAFPLSLYAVDWHVGAHVALTILLLRGLAIGEGVADPIDAAAPAADDDSAALAGATARARAEMKRPRAKRGATDANANANAKAEAEAEAEAKARLPWALVHLNTLLCVLWAGGTVVLGTSDNSTPNMYSNLRQQGGSNHLLPLPLSLMQQWRYEGHGVSDDPFSGGIVRVESHNSSHMAGYCPAETTAHLSSGSVELLRMAGHSGRVFNPAFALNIGPHAMPRMPAGQPFVRYTLPAYELRRQLHDAMRMASEAPFELTYTSLPGAFGDERWRVHAGGRTIKLVVARGGARAACTVLVAGDGGAADCQTDDVALAPMPVRDFWATPLGSFFGGMQSWNPQPIFTLKKATLLGGQESSQDWEEQTEIHCYG